MILLYIIRKEIVNNILSFRFVAAYGVLALCLGCGDPTSDSIDDVISGGEDRERARMDLVLSDAESLPAILEAAADPIKPVSGRVDLIDVVGRIYQREATQSILVALKQLAHDEAPEVRAIAISRLGNSGKKELIHDLLRRLAIEIEPAPQLELVRAIQFLGGWRSQRIGTRGAHRIIGGEELAEAELKELADKTAEIYAATNDDTLRRNAGELMEKMVAQMVQEGDKLVLKANLEGAEELYLKAHRFKPDSKNPTMRLGKFYFNNGQRLRGLDLLEKSQMALRVPRLREAVHIDGDLSDPVWKNAARIDQFYKMIRVMSSIPGTGRSEAYVAYTDSSLLVAVKGYEEDTSDLQTWSQEKDDGVTHKDPCMQIFIDADRDEWAFHHIYINSIGVVGDRSIGFGKGPSLDWTWDADLKSATQVNPKSWAMECEIMFPSVSDAPVEKGDVWGFSVGRLRSAKDSELAMWTPTYGLTRRPDRYGWIIFD